VRGRDSRNLWGPGEGRGACESEINPYSPPQGPANARRYRRACRASMMKELPDASGAFLVRGPMINRGDQREVLRGCFQHRRGSLRYGVILTIVGFLRSGREDDDCVLQAGGLCNYCTVSLCG